MWSEAMIDSSELVSLGLLFGAIVMSIRLLLEHRKIKSHFTFTYMSFGFIVFGMASLGGLFRFDNAIWLCQAWRFRLRCSNTSRS